MKSYRPSRSPDPRASTAVTTTAHADTLLVLNKGDSTLSFVDPGTLTVMTSIPTGDTPHEVEVSKDGRIAVVTVSVS